jgi:hypothetical protein
MEKNLLTIIICALALFGLAAYCFGIQNACKGLDYLALTFFLLGVLNIIRCSLKELITGKRVR